MDFNSVINSKCENCGGSGIYLIGQGNDFQQVKCQCSFSKDREALSREITQGWLEKYIPNKWYRDTDFDVKTLTEAATIRNVHSPSFIQYTIKLSAIIKAVQLNRKPNYSYFIHAPKGYGKKYFAYTLMREMYKKGLNVSPLYPIWEMRDVWVSVDKSKEVAKMFDGIDVMFLTMGKRLAKNDLYFLDFILYECELRGIAVIAISRFDRKKFMTAGLDTTIVDKVERYGAYSEMEYIPVNIYE